jgi:HlyD family secretion protein
VLLVPNAALRFTPSSAQVQAATPSGGFLRRLLPGPPARRPATASPPVQVGITQRVWALREGAPVPVDVQIGQTDGVTTQIVAGDVQPGLTLIVDAAGAE